MSDRIKIYNPADDTEYVEMPVTKGITYGKETQYTEVEMISGRKIRDVKGSRKVVTAVYDAVPAATISALNTYLSTGKYLTVTFPGIDGDETAAFSIPYPTLTIFKFNNGNPVWHNISLKMTAQEVET